MPIHNPGGGMEASTKVVGFDAATCDYVCDGVADNVQIQTALTAVGAAGGGSVILQRGTYNLDATVAFANHYCRLAGQGIGATVLRATSVLTHMVTVNYSVCCFEDLSFESNAKATDGVRLATGGSGGALIWFSRVYFMSFTGGCGVKHMATSCSYNFISDCYGYSNAITFYLNGSNHLVCSCLFGGDTVSISSASGTYNVVVSGNMFIAGTSFPIDLTGYSITITGNIANICAKGFRVTASAASSRVNISNNMLDRGSIDVIGAVSYVTIANNLLSSSQSYLANSSCIYVSTGSYVTVTGNVVYLTVGANLYGIHLSSCLYGVCSGNTIAGNSAASGEGIRVNTCTNFNVLANIVRNFLVGIDVVAGTTNKCKDNQIVGSGTLFADTGVDTAVHSVIVPFVGGTDPQDSGFLVDSTNGGDDFARTYTFLPVGVQQVVRAKVYARAAATEVHSMEADFTVYGAADNEPYTTHNGSVASLASTSVNFAADDVVYWTLTAAGLLAMLGKDSIQVKVDYAAAEGDNCATNAYFRTVEIEYV